MPTLLEKIEDAREQGISESIIQQWVQQQRQIALEAGFGDAQFDRVLGKNPYDPTPAINFGNSIREGIAEGNFENFEAGIQASVSGLALRQRLPDLTTPADADTGERISAMLGTVIGDLPAILGGFAVGGGPIAGTGLAFGLAAFLREMMMDQYENGEIDSAEEFWERLSGATIAGAKGYAVGAATGGVGKLAKIIGLPPLAASIPEFSTMVTVGAAVEGHLPQPRDFLDVAILFGGVKLAKPAAKTLREIYTRTGRTPKKVLKDAQDGDPTVAPAVLSSERLGPDSQKIPNSAKPPDSQANLADKTAVETATNKAREVKETTRKQSERDAAIEQLKRRGEDATNEQLIREQAKRTRDEAEVEVEIGKSLVNKRTKPQTKSRTVRVGENTIEIATRFVEKAGKRIKQGFEIILKKDGADEILGTAKDMTSATKLAVQKGKDIELARKSAVARSERKGRTEVVDIAPVKLKITERLFRGLKGIEFTAEEQSILRRTPIEARTRAEAENILDALERIEESLEGVGGKSAALKIVRKDIESINKEIEGEISGPRPVDRRPEGLRQEIEDAQIVEKPAEVKLAEPTRREIQIELEREGFTGTNAKGPFKKSALPPEGPPPSKGPPGGEGPNKPPKGAPDPKVIDDRIGKSSRNRTLTHWEQFVTDWVDHTHPIRIAMDKMFEGKPVEAVMDAYRKIRLFVGVESKIVDFLQENTRTFKDGKVLGPGLRKIIRPIRKRIPEFIRYLIAKRVIELQGKSGRGKTKGKQGILTGFESEVARKNVRETVEFYEKEFEPIREQVFQFQKEVLQYLRDSGVVPKKTFDLLIEENPNFTPFFRAIDIEFSKTGIGKGVLVSNPLRPIFGSEAKLINPLESIVKNTALYVTMAARADATNTWFRAIEGSKIGNQFGKKRKAVTRPTELTKAELKRVINRVREDPEAELTPREQAAIEEEFTIFRASHARPGENTIIRFVDGKKELWDVQPDVAKVLNGLDRESVNTIIKFLSIPTQFLRGGAVLSPDFITRNIARDTFGAHLISDNNFTFFVDSVRGLGHVLNQGVRDSEIGQKVFKFTGGDKIYSLWLSSGAAQAELAALGKNYGATNLRSIMGSSGWKDLVWNGVKTPLEVLRALSLAGEQATRIGEFKKALPRGKKLSELTRAEIEKAGFDSRNLIDFGRMGARVRALNHLSAFFNANIQGKARFAEAVKNQPARTGLRIFTTITLPSILLRISNEGEEGFDEIPRWQKDMFWVFPIFTGKDRVWMRIPKPFEAGILFGTFPERMVEFYLRQNENAMDGFLASLRTSFIPNPIPTAVVPIVETYANRNLFTDRPIIPHNRERILPEYQYNAWTSPVTRWLGSTFANNFITGEAWKRRNIASPAVIDNFVRGWSGGLGVFAIDMLSRGLELAGILPDPIRPADTASDLPLIRGWVIRHPSAGAQSITNFYDNFERHQQRILTYQTLAREGEFEAAFGVAEAMLGSTVDLTSARDAITNISRVIRLIVRSESVERQEKVQLIDEFRHQQIAIAKFANQIFATIEDFMP